MTARPDRRTIRLRDHDYRSAGAYFVTICTHRRECVLGEVVADRVVLSPTGELVASLWALIPEHFLLVDEDAFGVMPNHVHGVLIFTDSVGAKHASPLRGRRPRGTSRGSLPASVQAFKSASTRAVNLARRTPGAVLGQRGFYDHIIRNEADLDRIRRYIDENPLRWALDEENPTRHA